MFSVSHHQGRGGITNIDNYAVVQRWGGDKRGHTRGRSKEPARAVWNRLDAIRAAREAAGTETRVRWVHSHVEAQKGKPEGEPVGKKQKKAIPREAVRLEMAI